MVRIGIVAGIWLLAGAALVASAAGPIEHKPSGLTLALPTGWYATDASKDPLILTGPMEEVEVTLRCTDANEGTAFAQAIEKELDGLLTKLTVKSGPTKEVHNGLTHFYLRGTGTQDNATLDWKLTLIVGEKKSLILLAVGDVDKHAKAIQALSHSAKK